jgi:hypothetical protein
MTQKTHRNHDKMIVNARGLRLALQHRMRFPTHFIYFRIVITELIAAFDVAFSWVQTPEISSGPLSLRQLLFMASQ